MHFVIMITVFTHVEGFFLMQKQLSVIFVLSVLTHPFSVKPSQTFEAKLLHIESRPGRKSKNSVTDLEFFMKCEVHSSDLDVFINALKRVADDVCSIPDEKGEYSALQALFYQCMIKT